LRRFAESLLDLAIRCSAGHAGEWAQAMKSELHAIPNAWSALRWSVGCSFVLFRQSLESFFLSQTTPSELLVEETRMSKPATWALAISLILAVGLFFIPNFRDALDLSFAQWRAIRPLPLDKSEAQLRAFGERAERSGDADAMSFVAIHTYDEKLAVRLAQKAVARDSHFTWIFGVIPYHFPDLLQIPMWMERLKEFDPGNALPFLVLAEFEDVRNFATQSRIDVLSGKSPVWRESLDAAFRSRRLDNYFDRCTQLNQAVYRRFGYRDADVMVWCCDPNWLPTYAAWDTKQYAQSRLDFVEDWLVKGQLTQARSEALFVTRFLEMISPRAGFPVRQELWKSYILLSEISKRQGDEAESGLFAIQAQSVGKQDKREIVLLHARSFSGSVTRRDAYIVRIAGIVGLIAFAVVVSFTPLTLFSPKKRRVPGRVSLGSSFLLLASMAVIYLTYLPYARIIRDFLDTGNTTQLETVAGFFANAYRPFVYPDAFWLVINIILIATLAWLAMYIGVRELRSRSTARS